MLCGSFLGNGWLKSQGQSRIGYDCTLIKFIVGVQDVCSFVTLYIDLSLHALQYEIAYRAVSGNYKIVVSTAQPHTPTAYDGVL